MHQTEMKQAELDNLNKGLAIFLKYRHDRNPDMSVFLHATLTPDDELDLKMLGWLGDTLYPQKWTYYEQKDLP